MEIGEQDEMNDEFDFSFNKFESQDALDTHTDADDGYEEIIAEVHGCQLTTLMPEDVEDADAHKGFNDVFSAPEPEIGEKGSLTETDEDRKREKTKTIFIAFKEFIVRVVREGVSDLEKTSSDKSKVREYNKTAEMPKIAYAKPVKGQSFVKKLVLFLLACTGVGVFLGAQANSYYIFKGGKVDSAMACAWSWLMEENMPFSLSPLYFDVFGTGFLLGFGILGIIGLFIWLDNDAKKQSRVGHEHGKAHLGTARDFKIYKNKFMEK